MGLVFVMVAAVAAANEQDGRSPSSAGIVFVEAEGFGDHGGWVVDQQSMDQMGSPYLLAHGLGSVVKDAVTNVEFPAVGTYRLLVRTRNWTAPWTKTEAPGRFQVLIDGRPASATFGIEGANWHWQDGGTVRIEQRKVALALHDLTGFEGRCDAILFVLDSALVPPNAGAELADFRRRASGLPENPDEAGDFDLVVVGGGMAGTCAAISAARLGLTVALIQNRPVLGGNNSSEIRVGLAGKIFREPYPALGAVVQEIGPIGYYDIEEARRFPDRPESKKILAMDPVKEVHNAGPASNYDDEKKMAAARAEKTLHLFLKMHAVRVERNGDRIAAVVARHIETGREMRFRGALFADCTGDATLGQLAGADFRVGRESRSETGESLAPEQSDRMLMGTSVQWYATKSDAPISFPECPWALKFSEETYHHVLRGDWDWETGMNRDQIADFEGIRDHAFRAVYGNWSYLKNHAKEREKFARYRLDWVAYIGGKRESRRLLGDVILCQQDIEGKRLQPDAAVTTAWPIDLHYPNPDNSKHFPGEEFRSIAKPHRVAPYAVPYRCFYSRNVPNLFMAGRNISVTHVALGTVRVQKTTGMMGEVVGMAASLCKKHNTDPRGVYEQYLEELKALMRQGVGRRS